ncbi:hypothetical protein R75461_08054 [Paraburkholderia nemoris]|nr:hypothetical protein R75461_08054 [Paraburkholderia nemoris]
MHRERGGQKTIAGKRDVYWLPSEEEFTSNQGSRWALPQATLQGYDAINSRFQELCLSSRPEVRNTRGAG